jgi:hypothetical protein
MDSSPMLRVSEHRVHPRCDLESGDDQVNSVSGAVDVKSDPYENFKIHSDPAEISLNEYAVFDAMK